VASKRKTAAKLLARADAIVGAPGTCPRLIHLPLAIQTPDAVTAGCAECQAAYEAWQTRPPELPPAPSPAQLGALVERADVRAEGWPAVRAALAAALEGDGLADPDTRRTLAEQLRALPVTPPPADRYPGLEED
jgi:hypothetical protein